MRTQKLELRWHGKDERQSPEPRLLIEKDSFDSGKPGINDNMLIFGDNLLGLKALEKKYTGKIKCIYIDPPYNTKSCFEHYDDNLEHSLWLSMMKERLVLLHRLLSEDGSIWISIDECECHYLKVLCDEIFGRTNFITSVIWQHSVQVKGYKNKFSLSHNYILSYQKSKLFKLKSLNRNESDNRQYKNFDDDPKGPWCRGPVANSLYRPNLIYNITSPSGNIISSPPNGWRWSKKTMKSRIENGSVCFNENEDGIFRKIYLKEQDGKSPSTIWFASDVGATREANREVKSFVADNVFQTPKPERLLQQILHISSEENDIILDSFAGSGTTGAVAQKMGRRWIMIELGEHCHTHIIPRLEKVICGEDPGGVTEATGWQGGGGFKYYEMAPSLMEKNRLGRWTINKDYNPAMLAEAVCLHAGYEYSPRRDPYWIHGYASENDYIYVTARTLTKAELNRLSQEVGEDQSLSVYCEAFVCDSSEYENLTIKKIPKGILKRCTWGKDDYSLWHALNSEAIKENAATSSVKRRVRRSGTRKKS